MMLSLCLRTSTCSSSLVFAIPLQLGQVEIENSQVPVADLTDDLDEAEPRWFQTLAKRRNVSLPSALLLT